MSPGADLDTVRWPHTSAFLYVWEREVEARIKRQPTLAWAYGVALAKAEHQLMERVG